MFATSRVFGVSVAAVVLLVAGCSSSGGKHATPTTTTVSPSRIVVKLGPCPSLPSAASLTRLNAGVQGLAKRLVPIAAVKVRACEYDPTLTLRGTFTLSQQLAAQFETETNRLPAGALLADCSFDAPDNFLISASDSQQVVVNDVCAGFSNGVFTAIPTTEWSNELQRYTTFSTATGTIVGTVREVGGPGPGLNIQIQGTVTATSSTGTRWQTTTTATRPFSISLPAGIYRFTGTSRGQTDCLPQESVVVTGGKTTQVEIQCAVP